MTDHVTDVSHDSGEAPESSADESRLDVITDESDESVPVVRDDTPPETPAFINWLRRLFGSSDNTETNRRRLRELSLAIEFYPDAPANYVLRGELYVEMGMSELAAADFRQALTLAVEQVETERWGVVAQAMQDRADAGLRRIEGD